ncbi:histidine kinase dimerization/phospho-acceptor domain-containing protein [Chryseomicrobium palamuruense]|uniref:histidine kinase n=1 Tax=Chryseomicrobium palamuruense TaxID=682973 RepID=A0ABV8UT71_9BACL
MNTNKQWGKWIILGVLTLLILLTIHAWAGFSRELIGQEFRETDQFDHTVYYEIIEALPSMLVEPITKEELMEGYQVTESQIEEYRHRYGDLQSQLDSIRSKYQPVAGEELSEELQAERDRKLADIRRNFEDDEYVEEKLRTEWERKVDSYIVNLQRNQNRFSVQYPGIGYSLTNSATGETFDKNEGASNTYAVTYGEDGRWLQATRLDEYNDLNYEIADQVGSFNVSYSGTVYIPNSYIGPAIHEYKTRQLVFWIITVVGIAAAVLGFFLWRRWKTALLESDLFVPINRQAHEIRLVVAGALLFVSYFLTSEIARGIFYYYGFDDFTFFSAILTIGLLTAFLLYLVSIVTTIHTYSYKTSLLKRGLEGLRGLFLNRSLAWQAIIILVIVFFWGFGTLLTGMLGGLILVWIPCTLFIGIPALYFLFSRIAYLNRTMARTSLLTEGVTSEPFEIRGRSRLADHAKELNVIRDQLVMSQSSQVKSERLKSELITNVSHDLRTPLTSIITYTDLLKNPDLTEEQRAQYVDVLERKSARLKTLIEDLFDVSKMASGNIELQKAKVDIASLLQQAIAEQQEALEKQNLDVRVAIGSQPIHALVDGQKIWRVMDNLLINISKYAMPGTRVYVSLQDAGTEAVLTFKNVSQYELGDDTAELTERFKRGDQSRHTDGSGLGLAIAQSIVGLHGGQFDVSLDGDLFKVTLRLPKGAL